MQTPSCIHWTLTVPLQASYQVSQVGELIPVDVPPLDVVLVGLQRQDGWFRGRPLELREERKCTTPPIRTTQTLTSPGRRAHHPLCQYEALMLAWPRGFLSLIRSMWALLLVDSRGKHAVLSNSRGEKKNIRSWLSMMTTLLNICQASKCKHKRKKSYDYFV